MSERFRQASAGWLVASHLAMFLTAGALSFLLSRSHHGEEMRAIGEQIDGELAVVVDALAWGFAPADQVKEMIAAGSPDPTRTQYSLRSLERYNGIRLAILAGPGSGRKALFDHACGRGCNREGMAALMAEHAQRRLVSPGNDMGCEKCAEKRRPLPELESP